MLTRPIDTKQKVIEVAFLLLLQNSVSSSCSGAHWNFSARLMFALRKLGPVSILPHDAKALLELFCLPNMDKSYHGFSAGKQLVASCLYCMNCRLNLGV